jgi:hypothetical protein
VTLRQELKKAGYPNVLNTLGDHRQKRRLDLGLLWQDVAREVGTGATNVTHWSKGHPAPGLEFWPSIIRFLGFDPRPQAKTIAEALVRYQKGRGMSSDAIDEGLVRLAHQRWAIEQQYQELKTELGLDHFEGRSYPGWTHHVVLTAVAYAFLQRERMRRGIDQSLTFPGIRAIVQEIFTALLFAQQPNYFKRIQELQQINLRI